MKKLIQLNFQLVMIVYLLFLLRLGNCLHAEQEIQMHQEHQKTGRGSIVPITHGILQQKLQLMGKYLGRQKIQ
jgi:hypothetical protein